ncbi:MAG: hypothetical protein K0Q72_600 [Armatimonadetes bacterium]|nr:hypothetical protein [Armatimonadota bacterium]
MMQQRGMESWLAGEYAAICAPPPLLRTELDGESRWAFVCGQLYPRLLRLGCDLPLSVVADLTLMFLEGGRLYYECRHGWPLSDEPALGQTYCRALNTAAAHGALRGAIDGARRAAQQHPRAAAATNTDGGAGSPMARACAVFVEIMAAALSRRAPELELPARVRSHLVRLDPSARDLPRLAQGDAGAKAFLKRCLTTWGDLSDTLVEPFGRATAAYLIRGAARAPEGPAGLDLPLLQGSLDYQALVLTARQRTRVRYLQRTLTPLEQQSARSPELGNHDISRKGSPTAVLRSDLARPYFMERVALKQVLYFDRYAAQQAPHRLLLAWVVEVGRAMYERTPPAGGIRRTRA